MNEYLAIWGDWEFVIYILLLIGAIVLALYFEGKYLDERRKNRRLQCFITYLSKTATEPLKATSKAQKIDGGKPIDELIPMNKNIVSPMVPQTRIKRASIILFVFISHIIERAKTLCQPKKNDTT